MVCKYKDKNGACQAVPKYLEYCHKVFFPKRPCIKEEPMTNADRIRSMMDEELARFLWGRHFDDTSFPFPLAGTELELNLPSNWLAWLKQEVKE